MAGKRKPIYAGLREEHAKEMKELWDELLSLTGLLGDTAGNLLTLKRQVRRQYEALLVLAAVNVGLFLFCVLALGVWR